MALRLGQYYRSVYGAVNSIRMAILSHTEDAQSLLGGEIELDEAYSSAACARANEPAALPAKCPSSVFWSATASDLDLPPVYVGSSSQPQIDPIDQFP